SNVGLRDCVSAGHDGKPNHIEHRSDGSRKISVLVMFSIVGGLGFGIVVAVLRLADNRHRLRLGRLAAARA
ncbi:MAG: hypothetical protein VX085_08860, partial [Pseudomonadota bacterium]|nr:hypothetical protein [Pseudomonadota bacterium]